MSAAYLDWSTLKQLIHKGMNDGDSLVKRKWVRQFLENPVVVGSQKPLTLPSALQEIYTLQERSEDKALLFDVVDTCYFAATYSESKDPLRERRVIDSNFLETVPSQRTHIKQIRRVLTNYPVQTGFALAAALLEWKQRRQGTVIFPAIRGARVGLNQIFGELLDCYDSALQKGLHGAKRGRWLHRVQLGAVLYPDSTPLDQKTSQPNSRLNSLLFHLVFLFRQATSSHPIRAGLGEPMPKTGRPHYPLVTLLVNATLPDDCSKVSKGNLFAEQQTRQRVIRLQQQQVKWAPWPR